MHTKVLNKEGFPLVMLHGWGHSHKNLLPLGELLTSHSQVHLLDLPGFGQSHEPKEIWSSFDYADRLIAYLDEQKIQQADFLGHSFGGKVAMSIAIRYPNRVRNLVLLASSGLRPYRSLLKTLRIHTLRTLGKATKIIDRFFKTTYFSKFALRFGSTDYQKAGNLRPILVLSVNEDLSALIKDISCPTLILWGEEDEDTPLEMANRLHHLIKGSSLHIFPYKKHHIFQDVGAHLCAYHTIPFLENLPKESFNEI